MEWNKTENKFHCLTNKQWTFKSVQVTNNRVRARSSDMSVHIWSHTDPWFCMWGFWSSQTGGLGFSNSIKNGLNGWRLQEKKKKKGKTYLAPINSQDITAVCQCLNNLFINQYGECAWFVSFFLFTVKKFLECNKSENRWITSLYITNSQLRRNQCALRKQHAIT